MTQVCEVIVLVTSDIHGHIYPLNYHTNEHEHVGLGKIATIIKQEREKHEHVLLIDNGDVFQGTPLTTYYVKKLQHKLPNPLIKIMNYLGYDAAVIGNHEFNYGTPFLQRMVNESSFPWLSANVLQRGTDRPLFSKPYTIKQLPGGLKIAILGLTTRHVPHWENPEHIKGVTFAPPIEAAKSWVSFLRKQKNVDVVVVAYHGGLERNIETEMPSELLTGENEGYQMCLDVAGIDVLITGHQHRKIVGKEIHGVVVIQPGHRGSVLGKVTIQLQKKESKWQLVDKKTALLPATKADPHAEVLHLVSNYEKETQMWLDKPLGFIVGNMQIGDALRVRLQEHPLIEFIHRVQMKVSGVDISCTALLNNETNGFPSQVTMRDIVSLYNYPNSLTVLQLSGKDIKAALEQSATYFIRTKQGFIGVNPTFLHPKPQHYLYDMWEGIDYMIDVSQPAGQRIIKLNYNGNPIQENEQYAVVMSSYRAKGGGGYRMFKGRRVVKQIQIEVSEWLANFISSEKVIYATVNNNWGVIGGKYKTDG